MSDQPYTLQQVIGFRHAPQVVVRRLAHTAEKALERIDSLQGELRTCQESQAARQLERNDYIVVLLHRDGLVEVWSRDWRPVKFAHVPNLLDYDEAIAWACRRLPRNYAELLLTDAGRVVASDSTRSCLTGDSAKRVDEKLTDIAIVKLFEELAKAPEETPDRPLAVPT